MSKNMFFTGSAGQVGAKLQESYDRLLENTKKWSEILSFDPYPQTGMTPKEIVWRKNKAKLYRYYSDQEPTHRIPVLFLYALINKAYVLDLTPGMSVVESLVKKGFDVYLLEWGEFEWEDRNLTMADLVYDYIARAVKKVCQYSGSQELSIIGYCMGGTMSAMYASLFPQPVIRNLVLLASPIDFGNAGLVTQWLHTAFGNDVDKIVDTFELVPKEFVDIGLKMLNPVNNFIGTYTRLWKMIDEEVPVHSWKVLNKWVDDNVNFPGGAYRQWIKDLYQDNQLINNEFRLRGKVVDLARIQSSLLVLAGARDHIVLPHQVKIALQAFSSPDHEYHEFNIGHGGLVFGKVAQKQVYPLLSGWLGARSG
ncbi:MAG TPA: class III poly(R)-hydroxyalkanoic acid synthase subunit PhaC [Syntrophomonas sp.]|jgi:polyhydroxyalkanoate synthase|nr:class III poly(R)-hydroxyalkanoic acid synthase subunit PhaC [Syntrophomonas sp.]